MDQLLVKRSRRNGLLHSGQVMTKRYLHTMDELTCFLPGTLLLYLYHEDGQLAALMKQYQGLDFVTKELFTTV